MDKKSKYFNNFKKYKLFSHKYDKFTKTEMRYLKENNSNAFIWLHGFNDYYFHHHIGSKLINDNYDIYSITLRDYGQTVHEKNKDFVFCIDDVDKYIEDIDNNILFINKQKSYEKIILYGHSLGGLVVSVYLSKGKFKNIITKLVLNSPFYNFRKNKFRDFLNFNILLPFLSLLRYYKLIGNICIGIDNGVNPYREFLFEKYYYEKKYKLDFKKYYLDWYIVINSYHNFIKYNECLSKIPVLILYCNKNINDKDILNKCYGDSVLNVNDITYYSKFYFNNILLKKIKNSLHDIFASDEDVVNNSYNFMISWLNEDIKKLIFYKKKKKYIKNNFNNTKLIYFLFFSIVFLSFNYFYIFI